MTAKSIFWLLALCSLTTVLQAQTDAPGSREEKRNLKKAAREELRQASTHYLVLGLNSRYGVQQDLRLSPLTYRGPGIGMSMGDRKISPKSLEIFQLLASYNSLNPTHGESTTMNLYNDLSYAYLRDMGSLSRDNWKWYLGGEFSALTNVRTNTALGNSLAAWDGVAALGVSAAVLGSIELPLIHKEVALDYQLTLPLFAYINRGPAYSLPGLDPMVHYFKPLGSFTRVDSEMGLSFPLSKGNLNRLRFSYNWDFYGYADPTIHQVRSAQHKLGMELLIRL